MQNLALERSRMPGIDNDSRSGNHVSWDFVSVRQEVHNPGSHVTTTQGMCQEVSEIARGSSPDGETL